jgi:hypothetical protein
MFALLLILGPVVAPPGFTCRWAAANGGHARIASSTTRAAVGEATSTRGLPPPGVISLYVARGSQRRSPKPKGGARRCNVH